MWGTKGLKLPVHSPSQQAGQGRSFKYLDTHTQDQRGKSAEVSTGLPVPAQTDLSSLLQLGSLGYEMEPFTVAWDFLYQ